MKPHTYSTITLNEVKRCHQGIRVNATFCKNYGKKNDYSVLIKNAPKGLDLRLSGERDLLCILVENEIARIWAQSKAAYSSDLVTNCCNGKVYQNTQLCKVCGEQSELVATN